MKSAIARPRRPLRGLVARSLLAAATLACTLPVSGAHWHSHCARCAARLGETFTLGPDGPFRPKLYKQRIAIKAMRLPGPFVLEHVQRQPNLAMLGWLQWFNQRESKPA